MKIGKYYIYIKSKGELILPGIMLIFSFMYLREVMRLMGTDSMLLVRFVLAGVVGLSLYMIIREIKITSEEKMEPKSKVNLKELMLKKENKNIIIFVVMTTIAVSVIMTLGYVITFGAYLIIMMYLLGIRNYKLLAGVPVGLILFLFLLFQMWLRVPLPKGILRGIM